MIHVRLSWSSLRRTAPFGTHRRRPAAWGAMMRGVVLLPRRFAGLRESAVAGNSSVGLQVRWTAAATAVPSERRGRVDARVRRGKTAIEDSNHGGSPNMTCPLTKGGSEPAGRRRQRQPRRPAQMRIRQQTSNDSSRMIIAHVSDEKRCTKKWGKQSCRSWQGSVAAAVRQSPAGSSDWKRPEPSAVQNQNVQQPAQYAVAM